MKYQFKEYTTPKALNIIYNIVGFVLLVLSCGLGLFTFYPIFHEHTSYVNCKRALKHIKCNGLTKKPSFSKYWYVYDIGNGYTITYWVYDDKWSLHCHDKCVVSFFMKRFIMFPNPYIQINKMLRNAAIHNS